MLICCPQLSSNHEQSWQKLSSACCHWRWIGFVVLTDQQRPLYGIRNRKLIGELDKVSCQKFATWSYLAELTSSANKTARAKRKNHATRSAVDFVAATVPQLYRNFNRTVPYRTVPYRTETVSYATVPYCTVLYRPVLYRTIPYCNRTVLYRTVTVPYYTVL